MSDIAHASESVCYLTTVGRQTGRPHTIEIWFALDGDTGVPAVRGRAPVRLGANLAKTPEVGVSIGG